jgi:uncharacterized protein
MIRPVFVDTAGWIMLANGSDPLHHQACEARDDHLRRGGTLVTTDYVVDETLTLLRMRLGLDAARRWWTSVEASPRVHMELVEPTRADRARDWFFRWEDKAFSFTDCTSFVVMREMGLTAALTCDAHFTHAGFVAVP